MAHCTLEDLTGDWIDASAESNQHMPQPESIRNILRYSAGLRSTKTSRFGTFTGLMN
jgi:hypothetical protein